MPFKGRPEGHHGFGGHPPLFFNQKDAYDSRVFHSRPSRENFLSLAFGGWLQILKQRVRKPRSAPIRTRLLPTWPCCVFLFWERRGNRFCFLHVAFAKRATWLLLFSPSSFFGGGTRTKLPFSSGQQNTHFSGRRKKWRNGFHVPASLENPESQEGSFRGFICGFP